MMTFVANNDNDRPTLISNTLNCVHTGLTGIARRSNRRQTLPSRCATWRSECTKHTRRLLHIYCIAVRRDWATATGNEDRTFGEIWTFVAIWIRQKPRNHLKNQTWRLVFEMISRFLTNRNSHRMYRFINRPIISNFVKCFHQCDSVKCLWSAASTMYWQNNLARTTEQGDQSLQRDGLSYETARKTFSPINTCNNF